MPAFDPFRGLRFSKGAGAIEGLVSPPYDVFDLPERQRLAALSSRNIVNVDYPIETDGPDRYRRAATTLSTWRSDGTVILDESDRFYLYRMEFVDDLGTKKHTVGAIGALGIDDVDVLPHEQTTPKAKSDRLDLLEATGVNLSPIWGLSLSPGLSSALGAPGLHLAELIDAHGVTHRLEAVDDEARVAEISAAVSRAPVLIADGHHRLAVSREFLRGAGSERPGATRAMTYVAELTEEQLSIQAIHRLVNGIGPDELHDLLMRHYEPVGLVTVDAGTLVTMRSNNALCLVRPDRRGTLLRLRRGALADARPIDSARLEAALAGTRTTLSYQHDLDEVLRRLDSGQDQAAVLINPVAIDQIRDVAVTGQLMPPKSTFFTPKLLTGLVMRDTALR